MAPGADRHNHRIVRAALVRQCLHPLAAKLAHYWAANTSGATPREDFGRRNEPTLISNPEASGIVQNLRGARRQAWGGGNDFGPLPWERGSIRPVLGRTPLDEIRPEEDAVNGRKARQMEPVPRRRIRHPGADGELLGVQRLIQPRVSKTTSATMPCNCLSRRGVARGSVSSVPCILSPAPSLAPASRSTYRAPT